MLLTTSELENMAENELLNIIVNLHKDRNKFVSIAFRYLQDREKLRTSPPILSLRCLKSRMSCREGDSSFMYDKAQISTGTITGKTR